VNPRRVYGHGGGRYHGFALALVVVVTLLLSLVGMAMLRLAVDSRIRVQRYIQGLKARNAADAGLAVALYQMNRKLETEETWDNSLLPMGQDLLLPGMTSTFSYEVTGSPAVGFQLVSLGVQANAQRTVYATITLHNMFGYAVATEGSITLWPNTTVDGYNSVTGESGLAADLGTNSTAFESVVIESGATLVGDIAVGLEGDPTTAVRNDGTVTGDLYTMSTEIPFPPISPPELGTASKDLVVKGDTLTLTPADSGKYTSLAVLSAGRPGLLEITDGHVILHVTEDILLGQDCEIRILNGASLELYLQGDLEAKNNSGFTNETKNPASFVLYGIGSDAQQIDLKAKGEFYGAAYAPNAALTVYAKGDIYGAFAAGSFGVKSKSDIHYDHALGTYPKIDDQGVWFELDWWGETKIY